MHWCLGWVVVLIFIIIAIFHVREMNTMAVAYDLMIHNPWASGVDLYNYKGQKIYLLRGFGPGMFDVAYDANGKKIGAPTGGLTGQGDGTMPDWPTEARFIRNLYTKKHK